MIVFYKLMAKASPFFVGAVSFLQFESGNEQGGSILMLILCIGNFLAITHILESRREVGK